MKTKKKKYGKAKEGKSINSSNQPTTQDSIDLYNNAKEVDAYYKSKRYTDITNKLPKKPLPKNTKELEAILDSGKANFDQMNSFNQGIITPSKDRIVLSENNYRQVIDKNKLKQRENAVGVLDTRSPMQLFDKRIMPQQRKVYENDQPGDPLISDNVDIYQYDPIAIKPVSMLTPKERKIREQKYPNSFGRSAQTPPTKKPNSSIVKSQRLKDNIAPIDLEEEAMLPEVMHINAPKEFTTPDIPAFSGPVGHNYRSDYLGKVYIDNVEQTAEGQKKKYGGKMKKGKKKKAEPGIQISHDDDFQTPNNLFSPMRGQVHPLEGVTIPGVSRTSPIDGQPIGQIPMPTPINDQFNPQQFQTPEIPQFSNPTQVQTPQPEQEEQQPQPVQKQAKVRSSKQNKNFSINTGDMIAGIAQGINSVLPYQKPKDNKKQLVDAYNPYPQGTGSHATYENGGEIAKSGIHIKKKNRGKFTAYKKRTGKTTEQALHSKDPHVRKMAQFAKNAKKWKHEDGGEISLDGNQITPQMTNNWNSFIQFAKGQPGYGEQAWNHNSELGQSALAAYNKMYPDRAIDPSMVGTFQQDFQNIQNGTNNIYGIAGNRAVNKIPGGVSKVDNYIGTKTSAQQYPIVIREHQDAKGNILSSKNYGTDYQKAAQEGINFDQPQLVSNASSQGQPIQDKIPASQSQPINSSNSTQQKAIKPDVSQYIANRKKREAETAAGSHKYDNLYMKYGGYVPQGENDLYVEDNQVERIGENSFTGDTLEFGGKSHSNGGTQISYNGKPVEVEKNETGFIDREGSLNILGNLFIPGSNTKFKEAGKKIAKEERRTSKLEQKGTNLINDNDPNIEYQSFSFNSGKVLHDATLQRQKAIADHKEELAEMQNGMLALAEYKGIEPKEVSKMYKGKAKYGIKMKAASGLEISHDDDFTPYEEIHKLETDSPRLLSTDPHSVSIGPSPEQPYIEPIREKTIPDMPEMKYDIPNQPHNFRNKVGVGDILPELAELFDKEKPVPVQQFNPSMYTPYRVSFQDRINANQGDYNATQDALKHNPAALGAINAQKYDKNNQILADEFRINQGIENDVINKNTALENQAQEMNIKLADEQMVRQTQAYENTRANRQAAASSISDKFYKNKSENTKMKFYEDLYHYGYDPKTGFMHEGEDYQVHSTPTSIADTSPKGKTKGAKEEDYYYDSEGNPIKKITKQDEYGGKLHMGGSMHGGHSIAARGSMGGGYDDYYIHKKKKKKNKQHAQ